MAALARLGIGSAAVRRLGLVDGDVEHDLGALVDAIATIGHPMVFAPWAHDHHCDHEACGNAALLASARTGATPYFGLFWAWTHTYPTLLARHRLIRLALTPATRSARLKAIEAHRSQVTDEVAPRMLTESDLDPLQWASEYYITPTET